MGGIGFLLFSVFPGPTRTAELSFPLCLQRSVPALRRLHIQDKVDGSPQKVGSVGLDYESIDGLKRAVRQLQMIGKHYDGEFWLDVFDVCRNDCTICQTQMVLQHNCIYGPRLQKLKALRAASRCEQLVSVFSEERQLSRVSMNAEESAVGSHSIQV
jgi:hypothetical protein